MKKLVSILLSTIVVLGCSIMAVNAQEEISDELMNAIKAYENEDLYKSDIILDYVYTISNDKYLVRYEVRGLGYESMVVYERIGEYKLTVWQPPVPLVLFDGALYETKEAYEKGMISENDLETISTFEKVMFEKVDLPYGDANGDWYIHVFDATWIQMYLAGLVEEGKIDLKLADYDRDEIVSVLDATAIQLKLAGLE